MPFIDTKKTTELLTVSGTTTGYVGVAATTLYYPGALVWMTSTLLAPKQYVITDVPSATLIGLREVLPMNGGQTYGRSDVSQWLTGDDARISQEATTVRVELNNISKISVL